MALTQGKIATYHLPCLCSRAFPREPECPGSRARGHWRDRKLPILRPLCLSLALWLSIFYSLIVKRETTWKLWGYKWNIPENILIYKKLNEKRTDTMFSTNQYKRLNLKAAFFSRSRARRWASRVRPRKGLSAGARSGLSWQVPRRFLWIWRNLNSMFAFLRIFGDSLIL